MTEDPSSPAVTVAEPGAVIGGPRRCLEIVSSSGLSSIEVIELESGWDEEALSSADILPPSSHGRAWPRLTMRPSAAPTPVADPLIGVVVADRYRILEPLGHGGMGVVYKVQHTRIGKLLAMKLLAGELSSNPEVARRFKREALTVSKLESPSTVQVFDFGVSDGLTYLVMELVNGENLGVALRAGGPLSFSRLGKIILQVCGSLAEAHEKGIVHRDIKPENVMLVAGEGGADLAKVLDFGLAKLRETEPIDDVTGHGTILGTPYYMAPEQILGEEVDRRADVYGVGALMYRLLTGHHVFTGPTPMAVLSKHLSEIPTPPAERSPELGIPLGISRLVMRALRKDPSHRFQRIEDLRARLVEELRAAGSSSVDSLVDPSRLPHVAWAADPGRADAGAIATRDEVDAYERKLRRTRYGAVGVAAALCLGAAGAGASLVVPQRARFSGVEAEPNDVAADATALALGQTVTGTLGKRIDATHGDRDFYAFDLPANAPGKKGFLRLRVGALPNLAMCTMLFRPGFESPVGQYCSGRPGRDLVIPAMQLDPGRYLIAVLQDRGAGADPFIHETISDTYSVLAESVNPDVEAEIEPNDHVASATRLGVDQPRSAAIGWTRDEDVFCAGDAVSGAIRWKVRAAFRDGGVIEATPLRGGDEGTPVRIHAEERGAVSSVDVVSPWQSAPIADTASPRCLRVRLTTDPWSPERGARAAGGVGEAYFVEVEAAH